MYGLPDSYVHRWPVQEFDPFFFPDESYQRPVYVWARLLFDNIKAKTLVDLGCGTGRKLSEFFSCDEAVGVERFEVLPHIRTSLGPTWRLWDRGVWPKRLRCDILLCADVIEHVEDPAEFLRQAIDLYRPRWVVLSTPAREHIRGGSLTGPPTNPCHAREWTMAEFRAFCEPLLDVKEHELVDPERATQCVVGRPSKALLSTLAPSPLINTAPVPQTRSGASRGPSVAP